MSSLGWILVLPVVAGIPLAMLGAVRGGDVARTRAMLGVGGVVAFALALLLSQAGAVLGGDTPTWRLDWLPEAGIDMALRLDALAFLFCFLILAIGLLVVIYARYYLHGHDPIDRFYATLMVFMTAMLGIALSDNAVVLLIFWELTSLSSFFLIGYWHRDADSRHSARVALAVTGGGGFALLAGLLVLGSIADTYLISEMAARRAQIVADPRYPVALVLILLGAFTKSAQFPFHFWLPAAMAAPTPVSAYLHSATMVKAGLLLVARLHPAIGGTEAFSLLVSGVGLLTMVFAAATAMFKHDLKGLLAYSTVSHLGLIMFLLGLSTPMAAVAAVFHIMNHAAFKAALFMSAGIIDHEAGTRDIRRLGGLWRYMPITMVLASIAAAAMAGVPPFNGFISKEMFLEQSLQIDGLGWFGEAAPWLATLGGVFSMAYSLRYVHDTFFNGPPRDIPQKPHDPGWGLRFPVVLLVLVVIAVGLAPSLLAEPLVRATALAIAGPGAVLPEFHLALWHGVNTPLMLSAIAISVGAILYYTLLHGFRLHSRNDDVVSARRIFERIIQQLIARAVRMTAAIDRGSLQRTVGLLIGAIVLASFVVVLWGPGRLDGQSFGRISAGTGATVPADPLAWVVWLLVVSGALATVAWRRDHVRQVVAAAIVGLGAVLGFARFSAPDLALTQLSVEIVTTILMFMGLALLPRTSRAFNRHPGRTVAHAAIALVCGASTGWLAWAAMTRPAESIAWYFIERSLTEGGGTNVVNVILVDFRGFDTLGEITVLGLAALGVYALLDGMKVTRPASDAAGLGWLFERYPLMLRVVAGWVLPFALLVAIDIFLRGHNLPGGGFIAGLVTSIALLLQYMAGGLAATEARLRIRFDRLAGWGLIVAAMTGIGSFLVGYPFLTSTHAHPALGPLGEIPLASAALFDLGVYMVVVGGTLLTVLTLGRVSRSGDDSPPVPPAVPAGLARQAT